MENSPAESTAASNRSHRRSLRPAVVDARLGLLFAMILADLFVVGDATHWNHWFPMETERRWYALEYLFNSGYQWQAVPWEWCGDVFTLALASSQIGLLTAWACLGRRWWALRGLTAAAGAAVWVALLANFGTRPYYPAALGILVLAEMATVAAALMAARCAGCGQRAPIVHAAPSSRSGRGQFGLADLLLFTCAISVLLGVFGQLDLPRLADDVDDLLNWRLPLATTNGRTSVWMLLHGVACGATGVLAIWATSRRGPAWSRVAVLAIGPWASAALLLLPAAFCTNGHQRQVGLLEAGLSSGAWLSLHTAAVAAAMTVARRRASRARIED